MEFGKCEIPSTTENEADPSQARIAIERIMPSDIRGLNRVMLREREDAMQDPLTDPIASLLSKMTIGAAVGWIAKKKIGSSSNSAYLLLGIAGALVGAKIAEALEVFLMGAGPLVGAALGAAFFVIGWRRMQPP
jgi:uncharacterized membrane protein YeaQ/YmgE (transglycosylase-associated protein family)